MPPPDFEIGKYPGPGKSADRDKGARTSSSTFQVTETRSLSEQEKVAIAEKVVRSLGFKSLDEFNKYDEAVQAAKRRRAPPSNKG